MRTLLLIDNNKDDLQFMKEAISSVDPFIQSLSFVYADEAMKALHHNLIVKPDIIFININMPAKSGLKCFLELRNTETFNDIPIFVYASKITAEIAESLKDAGATIAFEKPNTIRSWKESINDILNAVPNSQVSNPAIEVYYSRETVASNK
jgi:CheY-like chemotaxis protein